MEGGGEWKIRRVTVATRFVQRLVTRRDPRTPCVARRPRRAGFARFRVFRCERCRIRHCNFPGVPACKSCLRALASSLHSCGPRVRTSLALKHNRLLTLRSRAGAVRLSGRVPASCFRPQCCRSATHRMRGRGRRVGLPDGWRIRLDSWRSGRSRIINCVARSHGPPRFRHVRPGLPPAPGARPRKRSSRTIAMAHRDPTSPVSAALPLRRSDHCSGVPSVHRVAMPVCSCSRDSEAACWSLWCAVASARAALLRPTELAS